MLLTIDNFSYAYPQANSCALLDVNLSISQGTFNVICGPSGSGKTTLCKAIAGIVPNYYGGGYKGDVRLDNISNINRKIADIAMDVGIVLDDYESQLVSLTVEEELAFALQNRGASEDEIQQAIPQILRSVGLEGRETYQLDELSGGQRQRLVIASVIVTRPQILVLDEPVSALDPVGAAELYTLIDKLRQDFNMTVIVVEHNLNYVLPYMQNLILLSDAQVLKAGDLQETFEYMFTAHQNNSTNLNLLMPDLWLVKMAIEANSSAKFSKWRNVQSAISELKTFLGNETSYTFPSPILPQPTAGNAVDLQALNFAYRSGEPILHDINLTIKQGEFVALLGHNGSGKTTLSRMMMALNQPRSGQVLISGKNIKGLEPADLADDIGYVFQNPDLQILEDTVFEEVAYGARIKGYKGAELEKMVTDALAATGLTHLAQAYPRILSFGQKRRLGIAAALVRKPKILILDEITSGQDNIEKILILNYLKNLNEQEGLTIILITHDMPAVLRFATRVVTLKGGKVVFDNSVADFFSGAHPLNEWEIRTPSIAQLGNYFNLPNNDALQFAQAVLSIKKEGGRN